MVREDHGDFFIAIAETLPSREAVIDQRKPFNQRRPMEALLSLLAIAGGCILFGLATWLILTACTPIDDVNEPGLYRKLKDQEDKR